MENIIYCHLNCYSFHRHQIILIFKYYFCFSGLSLRNCANLLPSSCQPQIAVDQEWYRRACRPFPQKSLRGPNILLGSETEEGRCGGVLVPQTCHHHTVRFIKFTLYKQVFFLLTSLEMMNPGWKLEGLKNLCWKCVSWTNIFDAYPQFLVKNLLQQLYCFQLHLPQWERRTRIRQVLRYHCRSSSGEE